MPCAMNRFMKMLRGALFPLVLVLWACTQQSECPDAECPACDAALDEDTVEQEDEEEEDAAFRPDLAECTPREPASAAPDMYAAILERLTTRVPVNEGDWGEDFGDATAYAPPALMTAGMALCEASYMNLAAETLAHTHFLIDHFMEVLEGGSPDEIVVGVLGPIETFRVMPHEAWAADAHQGLLWLNDTLALFGDYLYAPLLDTSPYGPTAVTAIVAAENLRYALVVDPLDTEKVDRGLEIAAAIDTYAWDADAGYYLASPDMAELDLYPNVSMMIVWTLAHAATGSAEHLQKARDLFLAIAPLRLDELGAYHSIYSSTVPDYVSLSSQNYLMFALHLLHAETGDAAFRDEALTVLDFISTRLYFNGMAWHHWENGERANWYCSGCNFQLLYVISMLSE
jgi:hypothetical protein